MLSLTYIMLSLFPFFAGADNWKIGILAQRGETFLSQQWQPWINWLNQRYPQQHFSLVPLQLDDLSQDKADNIDFILTNQSQFFISMISLSVGWQHCNPLVSNTPMPVKLAVRF